MHRRGLRQTIVVVLFLAGAGAGAFAWSVDRQLGALVTSEHATSARFDKLVQSIARFDAAQQVFDANKESEAEWFVRVRRLLSQIRSEAGGLHTSPASAAAARTFADVSARVESAVARAEENLQAGHELMAADLVQDEGRPGADGMRAAVLEWRTAEAGFANTSRYELMQQLWTVLGATAGLWALGVLVLAPRAKQPEPAASLSLLEEPAGAEPLSLSTPTPPAPPIPPPTVAPVQIDLSPAAALCEEIARAETPDSVEALLARAASVIGSDGVVIWLKGEREELVPVAAYGYGPQAMTLILPLPLASENVTTAAWHTGQLQSVTGDAHSRGVIAVPLFQGPRGTGVFTAELTRAADTPTARALATILATQFAATVAPKSETVVDGEPTAPSLEATGS